jgi:hypothetical protein
MNHFEYGVNTMETNNKETNEEVKDEDILHKKDNI